jgi:hypothetical protein
MTYMPIEIKVLAWDRHKNYVIIIISHNS